MDLKTYLISPTDYQQGVALYDQHFGAGRWAMKMQAGVPLRVLHKNLVYQLGKLRDKAINPSIGDAPSLPVKKTKPSPVPVQTEPSKATPVYSDTLEGKKEEARDLYRYAGRRRDDLFSDDPQVRKAAALFIKSAMRQNRKLWTQINHFIQKGHWPQVDTADISMNLDSLPISDLVRMAKNLGPWLSKEKTKIASEKDPAKIKSRQAAYDQKQELLSRVRIKLEGK